MKSATTGNILTRLWDEIDWEKDYEEAEAKIAIEEKWFDRMLAFFKHKGWNIWDIYPKYIKYVPKKDLTAVGEIISKEIERLAMLKEKPKEFAWLLSYVKGVMGLSSVVDGVIKDGIRQMIAEHPDKVYIRNYLGTVL